jgi:hypothetical protein
MICWMVGVYALARNRDAVHSPPLIHDMRTHAHTYTQQSSSAWERRSLCSLPRCPLLSRCELTRIDTKMSLFQPNWSMKNCISRCFSATFISTGPLIACHNTTQQALSTHPYRIVSSLCIPTFMEKVKKWLWNSRTFARAMRRVSTHVHVTRSRAGSLQMRWLLEVVWCCANTEQNVLPNNNLGQKSLCLWKSA